MRGKSYPMLAGALSAAVALGVAELAAGLAGGVSLIIAIGNVVVDHTPGPVVKAAIEALGTRDKPALLLAVSVASIGIGALLGPLVYGRPALGLLAFAAFGLIGFLAGLQDTLVASEVTGLVALAAVASGIATLRLLSSVAPREPASSSAELPGRGVAGRRRFLTFAAGAAGTAVVAGLAGRFATGRAVDIEGQRRSLVLPEPDTRVAFGPGGFEVPNLSPLVVPNDRFYRIDTALVVPRVDSERWRLNVTGMVDRPFELTLAELLAMPAIEESITLACVSNEVGGNLVGNAIWRGIPLADVLSRAGVQAGATQIVGRSVDGFTTGFPTDVALDGRASMIAVGMNGEALPAAHGFPARLVIPGLYGYVSATKWLGEIELTTLEAFDAYWIPRGWSKQAPIKTQSRVDVPRNGATVRASTTPIAGVAWGGIRSISRVEVRVRARSSDEPGAWTEARLGEALSASSWRQWVLEFPLQAGDYEVEVRATDGEGHTQTEERQNPAPDGATGWHSVTFRVA